MLFPDQKFFHKLLTHVFTLYLDKSHYPALHDYINIVFLCDIKENEGKMNCL